MTAEEMRTIFENMNDVVIQPEIPMTLIEMQAYLKGLEDARNAMFDSIDSCYRSMKTD